LAGDGDFAGDGDIGVVTYLACETKKAALQRGADTQP